MTDLPKLPDRFDVIEELGDTALELTVRAHDSLLQRDVMLKLPARSVATTWSAKVRERLLREARAVAKIRHECIAPIHWVEETADGPLLVLDLPEGEALAERLEHDTLDPAETIALGRSVADAMAEVHYNGIVHRCIGPSSIRLLPNGKVQLGAFTFAKEYGAHHGVSSLHHGKREDTKLAPLLPDYSAPEQLAGYAAEPRSDIFALGCTLFRCLAGRDPFEPGREHEPMPDLRHLRKDVSKPLAEVIRKCTMFCKPARFATARDVADALKAIEEKATTATGPSRTTTFAFVGAGLACIALLAMFLPPMFGPASATMRGEVADAEIVARYQATYGPSYKRVHGLFVGIGEAYDGTSWAPLKNPVREIQEVSSQLQANDKQWAREGAVQLLRDSEATFQRVTGALETLVHNAEPEDAVLIYFAGHGTKHYRSFGICLADAEGDIRNGTGYLRREELCTYLDRIVAKHVLVILDCCHSGAVFDLGNMRGRTPGKEKRHPGDYHRKNFSREFLCSTAADELAADGTRMSPFANLLLKELRKTERPYVAAQFLSSNIAEEMVDKGSRSGRVQVPRYKMEQEGSFVFMLRGK
ncbi:MAG: serine/threonine protein kinase [Planctomycetota bacterium]|jgi:serine/threonine protein kinase